MDNIRQKCRHILLLKQEERSRHDQSTLRSLNVCRQYKSARMEESSLITKELRAWQALYKHETFYWRLCRLLIEKETQFNLHFTRPVISGKWYIG